MTTLEVASRAFKCPPQPSECVLSFLLLERRRGSTTSVQVESQGDELEGPELKFDGAVVVGKR
jgi:hypothetical protein